MLAEYARLSIVCARGSAIETSSAVALGRNRQQIVVGGHGNTRPLSAGGMTASRHLSAGGVRSAVADSIPKAAVSSSHVRSETHSVERHLDVDAPGYDVQIRRLIPHYDEMIEIGVELLAALAPPDGHVLDLGGGTGALSSAVLDALPGVRVTASTSTRTCSARPADGWPASGIASRSGRQLPGCVAGRRHCGRVFALHHVHDLQARRRFTRRFTTRCRPAGCWSISTRR